MVKKSRKQKYYLILSISKKKYGAFPFSKLGLEKAQEMVKTLTISKHEKFFIKEN